MLIIALSLVAFYTFRVLLRQAFFAKPKKGSNSVNTGDRVQVLHSAISLMALYQCIRFQYFERYAPDNIIVTKIRKRRNSLTHKY